MVCVNDVVDLVRRRCEWFDRYTDDQIQDVIDKHIEFGTISILLDKDKVIGVLRINVNFNVAEVCDLVIEEGYDINILVKQMTLELWSRFPFLKYFKYYRVAKYPLKKGKIYSIKRLMKVK